MKKIVSLVLTFAMLFGILTVFSGCGEPDDPGAKIAVYLGEEIYDFDPTEYYVNDNAAQVISLLYEPLFSIDEDGDRHCAVADDYEIDEEERTITIELRETYWSDSVKVTADDFIFAWRNILLNPATANPAAALLYDIENAVSVKNGLVSIYDLGIEKLDAYTLEITYRAGSDPEALLDNLAALPTSPVRQDKYDGAEGFWSKQAGTMVFNGPFQVVELDYDQVHNASFKLQRNIGYHQSPEKVDYDNEVIPYTLYSLYSTNGNKMQCTYEDLVYDTVFYMCDAPLADRNANKDAATVVDAYSTYSYAFNLDSPLFAIKEVRQALSMAIDRNAIASRITFAKAATGFVPEVVSNFREGYDSVVTTSRLAAAKALILSENVQAKLARLSEDDKHFVLTVNDDQESLAIAQLVEAAWEQLGFFVDIEALDSVKSKVTENEIRVLDSWIQYLVKSKALGTASEYDASYTLEKGRYDEETQTVTYSNFDVIALDWQFFGDDPFLGLSSLSTAFSGNGFDYIKSEQRKNITGWSDYQYDSYITTAYKTFDAAERNELLHKAEQILLDAMPVVPLVFNQNFSFTSDKLDDVEVDAFGRFIFTEAELDDYQNYYSRYED